MSMLLSFFMAFGTSVRARAHRNVVFGSGKGDRLDVYAPVGADGEAPVVVFAHSGWPSTPDRRRFAVIGNILASRGFVTVIPDYRSCFSARYPAFLQDIAAATAWAKANTPAYGGDPSRLFLVGHSSGAYTCAMLALDGRWLEGAGLSASDLRGVVGISGVYNFLPSADPRLTDAFGEDDAEPSLMPMKHARAEAPPMLLVAGAKDHRDPNQNSGRLAAALRTAGARVSEIRYPKLGDCHGLHGLAGSLQFRGIALEEVERFIRLHSLEPAVA
jgi:acetyl esterase/lipase